MDQSNDPLVLKVTRHEPSRKTRTIQGRRTQVGSREDGVRERDVLVGARKIIEAKTQEWDSLPVSDSDSLQKARSRPQPFVLHGFAQNAVKTYMVMDAALGELTHLMGRLDAADHSFATQALWAQVTSELQPLHEDAKLAHFDLSSGNIFVMKTGQFRIGDFGLAQPLRHTHSSASGVRGNIVTPEAIGFGPPSEAGHVLGSYTDIFAAGALTLSFAAARTAANIFYQGFTMPGATSKKASYQMLMEQYAAWRTSVTDAATGRITAAMILGCDNSLFKNFFAPAAAQNPEICEAIVNDAMAIDPAKRATAALLGRQARGLMSADLTARNHFEATIAGAIDPDAEQAQYDGMALYDAWEQQRTQQHIEELARRPPPPGPKGR